MVVVHFENPTHISVFLLLRFHLELMCPIHDLLFGIQLILSQVSYRLLLHETSLKVIASIAWCVSYSLNIQSVFLNRWLLRLISVVSCLRKKLGGSILRVSIRGDVVDIFNIVRDVVSVTLTRILGLGRWMMLD